MKNATSALAAILLSACVAGCDRHSASKEVEGKETVSENTQDSFTTLEDRFSYAYGADLAEKFKAEGIELNVAVMAEAMEREERYGF